MNTGQKPSTTDAQASARGRAYGVAMELAGSIIGMALIGWLIDRWQGTSPRWTLILTALGGIGGFYNFIKKANALNKEQAAAMRKDRLVAPKPHEIAPKGSDSESDRFFQRDALEGDDDGDPDFGTPPDMQSTLEKRLKAIEKGLKDDAKS